MKKRMKRISAWLLAIALVITSAQWNIQPVEAALDVSNVEVTTSIINGGDNAVIANTLAETITVDGTTYNNYVYYEGVTASATSEMQAASKAIDHKENDRWESEHKIDPVEFVVDFGNVYSLKSMAVYWEGASSKTYEVWVSEDGSEFVKLTDVESNNGKRTDELTLSQAIGVRAVKFNCTSRTTDYGHSIFEVGFYGLDEQKEVVPVLSNLKVRDYYKYTGKYIIYFTEPEDVASYNVYIDDAKEPIKNIAGSGDYIDAEDLKDVTAGNHKIYVTSVDSTGKESAKVSTTFTMGETAGDYNGIAQLYINTAAGITSEYQKNVGITILDEDGNIDVRDAGSQIKIRGNTTAGYVKKPWNIKLGSKTKVLGMPKGKKWCVLANAFDRSLMRNRLSYEMGLQIGIDTNCESRIVEVYVNGKFNGNYMITEPVETGSGRVDIDPYNPDNLDMLLELGTRNEADVDHFTTTSLRTTFDVNEPEKDDDLTQDQIDTKIARVNTYLSGFEDTLKNGTYDEILEYIDEDSFVDFYIVNELFKNVDFNFSSTRFHISGETIIAGPMWDLDLSSGNCKSAYYTSYYVDGVSWKGYYCDSMSWYRQLLKRDEFVTKLKERYYELQYVIQNIYMEDSTQENSIDSLLSQYSDSFERNYLSEEEGGAGWGLTHDDGYSYSAESGWTSWEQPVEFLRDWLENRNAWMCEQWDIDMVAAYEEGKQAAENPTEPEEPETTTEAPTVEVPTVVVPDNAVVAFQYVTATAAAGDDLTEYAYADDNYTYKATTGTGTMKGSVNGTNLKHIEWGDPEDYGVALPVMPSSTSNTWTADAYVSYTFSTVGYENMSGTVEVGGTKKGPRDLAVGYYDGDEFITLATYTIPKNKTMYPVEFNIPAALANQESVTIYIKLTSTTNIGGNEMTSDDYKSGGELAFNNFVVVYDSEVSDETTTPEPETTTVAAETNLSITDVILVESGGKRTYDISFTPVSEDTVGDKDPYLYCIYIDEMNSDHSAINLSASWNWKDNFQWLNGAGGFNNGYNFDGAFTTAADFAANGKNSTYLEDDASHIFIIAAYESVADARADVNPIAVATMTINANGEMETTVAPTTTTEAVVLPQAPTGLVHSPAADGSLPHYFAWATVNGAESYNIYVNGALVATSVNAGYDLATYVSEAGEYTIEVTTVAGGLESEKATVTYTVEGEEPDDPETSTPEESSSDEPVEPETSTPEESSSDEPETSTPEESSSDDTTTEEPSTDAPSTEAPTTEAPTTTLSPEEEAKLMKAPGKVTIKKATKKAKKLSLKFKKVHGATAYEVAVYTTKKLAKKNNTEKAIVYKDVAKVKVALKSKKIKKAKKLFVRVRAFVDVRGYKKVGKWSKVKKVK